MASFTPPPSSALQPFNVQAPEYGDPLETLAKLRQNRLQNMQAQQVALKMASQKALMQAFAQAGRDPDELWKVASSRGDILPDDLVALQNHMLETQTKVANLDEKNRAKLIFDTDRYAGLMQGVTTKQGVAAANARAKQMGIFGSKQFDPIDPETLDEDTLADSLTFHVNALLGQSTMAKRLQEQATLAQTQAGTASSEQGAAASRLAGQKTRKEMDKLDLAAAIAAIQAAPIDEKTGTPTPAALAGIRKKFPDIPLGENPTKAAIDRFIRSGVDVEKQPKFDIEANAAAQGMTGTTQWDQFLFQNARGLGKKPGELSPAEYNAIATKYKELEQNPAMAALTETYKALQNRALGAQVSTILTAQQIENNARDLLNGDLAPDQIKELRAGRIQQGQQIIEKAREIAKAEGKPFSLLDLEMQSDFRQNTLKEFSNTLVSHAGGQKQALNTLIHHADLYLDAAAALKNGTWVPGNEVYNRVRTMFGAAPPTNAKLLAQFFAGETGKVATGGVPAEGEVNRILQSMSTDGSPESMEGAGRTLIGIAAGRMIPLKELRDKARLEKFVDILGPDAKEILQRRGFDPETMKPRAAGAGGGKHKVGDTVMYQGKPRKIIAIDPKTGKLRLQLD